LDGKENLIALAREGSGSGENSATNTSSTGTSSTGGGLHLSDTVKDALKVLLIDEKLRNQVSV
jgi:hypothetical protein